MKPHSFRISLLQKFLSIALWQRFSFLLSIIAVILGGVTFWGLGGMTSFRANSHVLWIVLLLDIVVLLLLSIVVARKLVALWIKRKKGLQKARLHVRLTMVFGALAVAPAIVMTLFSVIFFHVGIQDWFSTRVKTALDESVLVAQSYLEEHKRLVGRDASLLAQDLKGFLPYLLENPKEFNQYLTVMGGLRSMTEAIVFDDHHDVLGKSELTFALEFEPIPSIAIEEASHGNPVVLTNQHDRVRALIQISQYPERYLLVGRAVDPHVLNHLHKAEHTISDYKTLEGKRIGFEVIFIVLFSLVALLLLLVAVWVGLVVSGQIIRPIECLMEAADAIREGDFSVRVHEDSRDDELSLLSQAFNRMMSQLEANQGALLEVNQQLEERRRFIELTLSGVSSGVLGLNAQYEVNFINEAAVSLLGKSRGGGYGDPIGSFLPEIQPLLALATAHPGIPQEEEILFRFSNAVPKTFLVHGVAHGKERDLQGYVITLDDVTHILATQKQEAWSDVARRIAHEIKNPLTPIQLATERLKRKYLDYVDDPETFQTYIDMIAKQVTHIQTMIGDFLSFARMPSPTMKQLDLKQLCREACLFHETSFKGKIHVSLPENPLYYMGDESQLIQALTNVLKNAKEALEESSTPHPEIFLTLKIEKGRPVIELIDNGPGFPFATHQDVTEPYVTTRSGGAGLGLSIVKKIMEDHGGSLEVDNATLTGHGRVRLIF